MELGFFFFFFFQTSLPHFFIFRVGLSSCEAHGLGGSVTWGLEACHTNEDEDEQFTSPYVTLGFLYLSVNS